MELVVATLNPAKLKEITNILFPITVTGPACKGIESLGEETGQTYLDNALLKALSVFSRCGCPCAADDSGLEVLALGGAPGVRSARFSTLAHNDLANNDCLLEALRYHEDRRARFVCTVSLVYPAGHLPPINEQDHPLLPSNARLQVFEGIMEGVITDTPKGNAGFGYDPLFYLPELGCTAAQLTAQQKNRLSHRGKAFRMLRNLLITQGSTRPP